MKYKYYINSEIVFRGLLFRFNIKKDELDILRLTTPDDSWYTVKEGQYFLDTRPGFKETKEAYIKDNFPINRSFIFKKTRDERREPGKEDWK
jgi:hypothetical protein